MSDADRKPPRTADFRNGSSYGNEWPLPDANAEERRSIGAADSIDPSRIVTVLLVSPIPRDCLAIAHIFSRSNWKLLTARTLASAVTLLQRTDIPVVICEADLNPGTWRDLLAEVPRLARPPQIIVTSRFADDSLWAEVLNRGAYDVLAQPFDATEVARVVSLAWLWWKRSNASMAAGRSAAV